MMDGIVRLSTDHFEVDNRIWLEKWPKKIGRLLSRTCSYLTMDERHLPFDTFHQERKKDQPREFQSPYITKYVTTRKRKCTLLPMYIFPKV